MSQEQLSREDREIQHFEELGKEDGYIWWGGRTPAAKLRFERRRDLLKEHLNFQDGQKILEIGSGSAEYTPYIAEAVKEKNVSITGIELTPALVEIANKKVNEPNVNFVVGNVNEMPFAANSFDYAVGNSILHHLVLEDAFKDMTRVLKPGGKIMFFEPNLFNPMVWALFKIKPFRKLHGATPDEMAFYKWDIQKVLEKFNFSDITAKPFDFMFPLIPAQLFNITKKVEGVVENTPIGEIGGSLIIVATNTVE